jgi:hypothetical protein
VAIRHAAHLPLAVFDQRVGHMDRQRQHLFLLHTANPYY